MCTPLCPCDIADKPTWAGVANDVLRADGKNRVQLYEDLTAAEKTTLNNNQGAADLNWDLTADGVVAPLHWEAATPSTLNKSVFNNFNSCFTEKLSKAWEGSGDANQAEMAKEGMKTFGDMEVEMDCSSVCWMPLFGIKRELSKGPVTRDCADPMADTLKSLMGPAVVCLITFFILFCACCCSMPLCCGYNEVEEEDKGGM